jgi:two-component system NarL family sensor kinase
MTWIGSIAGVVILVVAAGSFALNVSEHRRADEKLRQLAQRVVQSQEDERARLSRDLHDGISQSLVSVKLLVDTALARLKAIARAATARRPMSRRRAATRPNC